MDLLNKGWECPKCGAVMSPTTSVCVNCRGFSEVTINTKGVAVLEKAKQEAIPID